MKSDFIRLTPYFGKAGRSVYIKADSIVGIGENIFDDGSKKCTEVRFGHHTTNVEESPDQILDLMYGEDE